MTEKDTEFLNKSKFKFQQKNVNEKNKIVFHQFYFFSCFIQRTFQVEIKQVTLKMHLANSRNTKQREKIDCFRLSQPMLNDCKSDQN